MSVCATAGMICSIIWEDGQHMKNKTQAQTMLNTLHVLRNKILPLPLHIKSVPAKCIKVLTPTNKAFNSLVSARIRGFSEKKRLNARGFAWEFLWSGMLYRPGKSLKRCGKSSCLLKRCGKSHSKDAASLLVCGKSSCVFCWSFYWKLGYNPSLLILWMTCWGFGFKSYDLSQ